MIDITFTIGIILLTIFIVLWYTILSPQARSTNELAKLNRITELFLKKEKSPQETIKQIESIQWKYHQDKADLFIKIMELNRSKR